MKDLNLIHQYSNRGINFEKSLIFLFVFNEMFTQSRYNPFFVSVESEIFVQPVHVSGLLWALNDS